MRVRELVRCSMVAEKSTAVTATNMTDKSADCRAANESDASGHSPTVTNSLQSKGGIQQRDDSLGRSDGAYSAPLENSGNGVSLMTAPAAGLKQFLSRMLSPKTYNIPTDTSLAGREHNGFQHQCNVRRIGEGMCGVVWATDTGNVIKLAKPGKKDALWTDCVTHRRVHEVFRNLSFDMKPDINIPDFGEWIHPSNGCWDAHRAPFPPHVARTYGLVSEQIYQLPEPDRTALWDQFAPAGLWGARKQQFLAEAKNQNCLVRVYLGRRTVRNRNVEDFKLNNFELHLNELHQLHLEARPFAQIMARTLAIMHWGVGVDADDIEFVLASTPYVKASPTADEYEEWGPDDTRHIPANTALTRRRIGLWMLDFNQCHKFPHTEEGVAQLVKAFFFNDPYYPQPSTGNAENDLVWARFRTVYLETSAWYPESSGLADRFVQGVQAEANRRSRSGPLFG